MANGYERRSGVVGGSGVNGVGGGEFAFGSELEISKCLFYFQL